MKRTDSLVRICICIATDFNELSSRICGRTFADNCGLAVHITKAIITRPDRHWRQNLKKISKICNKKT